MMMLAKFVPVFETKLVKKVLPAKLQNATSAGNTVDSQ